MEDVSIPAPTSDTTAPSRSPGRSSASIVLAGFGSLGAGAIHAAAIGAHSEHRSAVITFALLALFQLGWGAAALAWRSPPRSFVILGAVGNSAALLGWALAKTVGIGFIAGLETAESVQLADATAAAMALVATVFAAGHLIPRRAASPRHRATLGGAFAIPVAVLTFAAMTSVGSHAHHDAGSEGGHIDVDGEHASVDDGHDSGTSPTHETINVAPFDPAQEVDLSGVDGVSPAQQAEAEDLVRATIARLPQFADISSLNDKGYYSIGDSVTGDEHYVNWSYVDDDKILNPDAPESLVIRHGQNGQQLVAAMFMLPTGTTLEDVPDFGGNLVQWHVHADLCFTDDPIRPTLAFGDIGVGVDQPCTPPNVKRGNVPMVHVWIVPHPCGPFAALEGIGGGQIPEGETVSCLDVHPAEHEANVSTPPTAVDVDGS